jgi:GIY-YIG catalytic domain
MEDCVLALHHRAEPYYGVIYEGEINGKLYVGQHVGMDVEKRWRQHEKLSSGCLYFRNAIQFYGKENLTWRIIAYCKVGGQARLDAMERYFIKKRNSLAPHGYNLERGGQGGRPCEETRQKMSESAKKKFENPEAREKVSKGLKTFYEENPEAREKVSEDLRSYYEANPEARERMSESVKNYLQEHPEALEKFNEARNEYWADPASREKQSEAKKTYYANNPQAVSEFLERMRKWREEHPDAVGEKIKKYYAENPEAVNAFVERMRKWREDHPDAVPHNLGKTGALCPISKKVHQYSKDRQTFIKEWECVKDVIRSCSIYNVCKVCRGQQKTAGGFTWRYV